MWGRESEDVGDEVEVAGALVDEDVLLLFLDARAPKTIPQTMPMTRRQSKRVIAAIVIFPLRVNQYGDRPRCLVDGESRYMGK